MKILFLSSSVPFPLISGGRLRTASIVNALGRNEIYFLALQDPDVPADRGELQKYVKDFKFVSHKPHFGWGDPLYKKLLRVIYLALGIPSPVVRDFNPEFAGLVKRYVRELEPDIVVVDFLWLAQYIKPLKGKFRRVLNAHNVESDVFRTTRKSFVFWLPWKIWKRYEARTVRDFDLVLVTSENEKKRFLELNPSGNYLVVPNAVNTSLFKFKPYTRRGGLVFTGNFSHLPNVDAATFFVKSVFPLIRERAPRVQFSIVGSDPPAEVTALGKVPGVGVFSNVPDAKPYISSAAVAVVPIRSGSGTRLKILEAFALGTPVVSTSFGAGGLMVDSGKDLIIGDNAESFADAVVSLLNNQDLGRKITTRARKTVEDKYSWELVEKIISKSDLMRESGKD